MSSNTSRRAANRLVQQQQQACPFPAPTGPYYDPALHPEGTINLSTAENSLLSDEVIPILKEGELRAQHLKYRSTLLRSSLPQLADLLPAYLNRQNPIRLVTRDNSVPGPGVGSLLAHLIWAICDEGDGVLLSTPYYHDYWRDIVYPGLAKPIFANVPSQIDSLSPEVLPILRAALQQSSNQIRVLLLCNPHNPIPRSYSRETIEGYVSLANEFNLHLIVDEIFANTVYPTSNHPSPTPFTSILSTPHFALDSPLLQRLHVLGGPTKDLGCSGIKAGLLVTENADVRKHVSTALQATPISGSTDAALSEVLRDEARLTELLDLNKKRLGEAMDTCASWAKSRGYPFIEANAGVYFILDLSPVAQKLGLHGTEATIAMMKRMHVARVHVNPMDLDLDPRPHRFRFIFTHKPAVLKLALQRLDEALNVEQTTSA